MKSIDLTKPGGFRFTQDQLAWLQAGWTEVLQAIMAGADPGGGVPYVLSGMVVSGGGNTVSDGWFVYGGDIIQFTGGTVVPGGGEVALVLITVTSNALIYNDAGSNNVVNNKTASLTHAATATDATHFPVSAMMPWGQGLGKNNRESGWSTIAVATASGVGGVVGSINYKKDFTANTLIIGGSLIANNAQNFAALPNDLYYSMGTLPAAYRPSGSLPFVLVASFVPDISGVSIKDYTDTIYIKQFNVLIGGDGSVSVNWIKPDAAVASYTVEFAAVISLD